MRTGQKGIDLIKRFEGLRLKAYQCSAGKNTIGYGHTQGVKMGDVITEAQAEELLRADLAWAEKAVSNLVKVKINQNQFDALVSFVFNVGKYNFQKSTLLRKLNGEIYWEAAKEFLRWNKAAGEPLEGLTRRRAAERELFESMEGVT